jgi:hypothetical protein
MRDATRSFKSFGRNWQQVLNQTLHWTGAATVLVIRVVVGARPAVERRSVIPRRELGRRE